MSNTKNFPHQSNTQENCSRSKTFTNFVCPIQKFHKWFSDKQSCAVLCCTVGCKSLPHTCQKYICDKNQSRLIVVLLTTHHLMYFRFRDKKTYRVKWKMEGQKSSLRKKKWTGQKICLLGKKYTILIQFSLSSSNITYNFDQVS